MNLTHSQQTLFWRKWNRIVAAHQWDRPEAELERHALIKRAGFDSLTQVDHLKGFDRLLAALDALAEPDNLNAQLREQQMPRTRLLYAIQKLAKKLSPAWVQGAPLGSPYLRAIMIDRYGHADLDQISHLAAEGEGYSELEKLRNTLAARVSVHRARSHGAPASAGLNPPHALVA